MRPWTPAYARIAGLERDLAALDGATDVEGLRAALGEFDAVRGALDPEEKARILTLVLETVTVDGADGVAELKFRGTR